MLEFPLAPAGSGLPRKPSEMTIGTAHRHTYRQARDSIGPEWAGEVIDDQGTAERSLFEGGAK
jgi:hypothetical protein